MAKIAVYRCQRCGGPGKIIDIPDVQERVLACGGQIETIHLLRPFEDGRDGVALFVCPPEKCCTLTGSGRALRRARFAEQLVAETGLRPEHLLIEKVKDGKAVVNAVNAFIQTLDKESSS